jgi:hypothetical protein
MKYTFELFTTYHATGILLWEDKVFNVNYRCPKHTSSLSHSSTNILEPSFVYFFFTFFSFFLIDMALESKLRRVILTLSLCQCLKETNICHQVPIVSYELFLLELHGCTHSVVPGIKEIRLVPSLSSICRSSFFLMHLLSIVCWCRLLKN